jgi:hypothetical protein
VYNGPPYTNKFKVAALDNANIVYFFTQQATLMKSSTALSPPLQLVYPALIKPGQVLLANNKASKLNVLGS